MTAVKRKLPLKVKLIIAAVIVAVLVFSAYLFNNKCLGFTAYSKLETLNGGAREMWFYCEKYNTENSVVSGINEHNGIIGHWAAVYENNRLSFVLYSADEITEDELVVPDRDEQIKLLSNIFTKNKAIGCFDGVDSNGMYG